MNNDRPMPDEWMQPNPSPRTLFANFFDEEFSSQPLHDPNLTNQIHEAGPTSPEESRSNSQSHSRSHSRELSFSLEPNPNSTGQRQSSSNGGLAERMQARAGFNVPKLDTSRPNSVLNGAGSSSEVRSPYLTIPPGLSPTSLLDSPVFLANLMVQPSPTTGKLPFLPSTFGDISEAFSFRPSLDPNPSSSSASVKKESPASLTTHPEQDITVSNQNQNQNQDMNSNTDNSDNTDMSPPSDGASVMEDSWNATPDEDGYNWRKYGQKQVKESEYPRSYYKCTSPQCTVKKQVERSLEGRVMDIIYNGQHNHPKPLPVPVPNQPVWGQVQVPVPVPVQVQVHGQNGKLPQDMYVEGVGGPQVQVQGQNSNFVPSGQVIDIAEQATNQVIEIAEQATNQAKPGGEGQDGNFIEICSNMSNEEEDRATHGASIEETDDDDCQETDSKRRKLEACAVEINAASRAVREPRVVVQTTSEVDILDDGYRWRKYGQKVVKGNPNPRSYYKCTHAGCSVRKHVERASHDLKSVITTYEGRHNHEVPAARGHASSNTGPAAPNPMHNSYNRRLELGTQFHHNNNLAMGSYGGQMGHQHQMGPSNGGFNFRMGQHVMRGPPLPHKMVGMNMMNMNNMGNINMSINMNMGNYVNMSMMPMEIKEENISDNNNNNNINNNGYHHGGGSTSEAVVAYQQMINRMNMGGNQM